MAHTIQDSKRIATNTFLLYLRMLFIMVVNLYTSRIVLATLGVEDYGIYNVVGGFVTMFTFISGAMTTATQRFISFEIGKKDFGKIQTVFSTAVIIHLILAGIIFLVAEIFGIWFLNKYMNFSPTRYFAANCVFQFSLITFIVNVISVPYNASIIAYEKMKAFAYVSIVEVILKLVIVYLLIISPFDRLIVYSFLLAIISIIIRIIYGLYVRKNLKECVFIKSMDKSYVSKVMSFVSWNLIGSLSCVAKEQGVNIVINMFFGAGVNAARAIAYQVQGAVCAFVNNFQLAMNPQIVKSYAANEQEGMFKLVFKGSKLSFLLLLNLTLPLLLETSFILKLWLENVPDYTVIFLRLVLITALIDSLSGPLIASMHASGKVKTYQIVVGGISLLTLPIVYYFLRLGYPPYYAMFITTIMSIVCHFARLIILNRSINLPIFYFLRSVTSKVILVSIISVIFPYFFFICLDDSWQSFLLVCCTSLFSTLFFSYYLGLDHIEKVFLKDKLCHFLNRAKK